MNLNSMYDIGYKDMYELNPPFTPQTADYNQWYSTDSGLVSTPFQNRKNVTRNNLYGYGDYWSNFLYDPRIANDSIHWTPPTKNYTTTTPEPVLDEDDDETVNVGDGYKWKSDWLSLAPFAYNAVRGVQDSEVEPLVTNPYTGAVARTLGRQRYNVEAVKAANRRSRAISNYNLSNLNANTGANLAARTQAALGEYANNANLYTTKRNADAEYATNYANALNNLGQQYVTNSVYQNDTNAKNRAMVRNYMSTAMGQLGDWAQTNAQMRNAYNRDLMVWPFLAQYLRQGYTDDMVNAAASRVID